MEQTFLLKLLVSFFTGAVVVALVTVLSERIGPKLGGIVTGMPNSMLIALLFIYWTQGTPAAIEATHATLFGISGLLLYETVFFLSSRRFKGFVIPLSLSLLAWLLVALPAAYFNPDLIPASAILILFSIPAFYFLAIMQAPNPQEKKPRIGLSELAFRGLFGGTVVSISVILAKYVGIVYGGAFGAFPASLTSSLVILHHKHGPGFVREFLRTVPFGTFSLFTFSLSAKWLFPMYGVPVGAVLSLISSTAILAVMYYSLDIWKNSKRQSHSI